MRIISFLVFVSILLSGCNKSGPTTGSGRLPSIKPDYTDVTIPPNIAPLNFIVRESGSSFTVKVTNPENKELLVVRSGNGKIIFPVKKWKKILAENKGSYLNLEVISNEKGASTSFEPFKMNVAEEPADPYLAYRLIPPGYYSWSHIRIMQRCIEDFSEYTLLDNAILDKNCINCHSFAGNDPERFMVHVRGSKGGTYFMENGKIKRTDPRTESMPGSATYPAWHPGGRFIAYSSNQVRQSFYAGAGKTIEVFDLAGSIILFDTKDNEITTVREDDTTKYLRTFPGWSQDGKYLYYCRSLDSMPQNPGMEHITGVHHDLVRKSFDETTETFGPAEIVFNASAQNKSVSFPRISPDGKYLVFTLHDFGTFPIWHAEADLYSIELNTGKVVKMDLNSDFAESYHSWSSNGRWLVFSSKRADGRTTRPFFSYIGDDGKAEKPFMLPQKDPEYYDELIESFNIPEFVKGKINANARDFAAATRQTALKATSKEKADPKELAKKPEFRNQGAGTISVHE